MSFSDMWIESELMLPEYTNNLCQEIEMPVDSIHNSIPIPDYALEKEVQTLDNVIF